MIEQLQPYIGEALTAIIVAIVTWFTRGKRDQAEARSAQANAIEAMQRAYDIYVEHNNEKMRQLEAELKKLQDELTKAETYWKNKYNALKREFNDYKKKNPK